MPDENVEVYRDLPVKLILGSFWLVALIVYAWMILAAVDDYPEAWFAFLLPVPLVVMVGFSLRTKLVVSDEEVVVVNPYRTDVFAISEVAEFTAERTGPYGKQVVVRLKDGSWRRVAALQCGRGRACDKLEELAISLTQRLA
jgi:hypothetical protein